MQFEQKIMCMHIHFISTNGRSDKQTNRQGESSIHIACIGNVNPIIIYGEIALYI